MFKQDKEEEKRLELLEKKVEKEEERLENQKEKQLLNKKYNTP